MCYQQPILETVPEKDAPYTPVKETLKFENSEDCNSTDEGTFASPSSCPSDSEASSARCVDIEGSAGPSSSCTSDDENAPHSCQEADVSGLNSSCASDDEDGLPQVTAAPRMMHPPGLMPPGLDIPLQLPQVQQVPTPQCTRNKAPLAEQLASKLLSVSAGRPVKVWLSPDYVPLKRLDASLPAKKKPSFAEYASDKKKKTLDPSMPCKKHLPSWLANLDAGFPEAPKPKPQTFAPAPPAPVLTVETAPR